MAKKIEKELPQKRYAYTLEHLIKKDEIYILIETENKYALSKLEDKSLLSFWPTESIAQQNAKNNWTGFTAKKISIQEMEIILDLIEDKDWLMDIFPIDSKTGTIVTVDEFIQDLNSFYKELTP